MQRQGFNVHAFDQSVACCVGSPVPKQLSKTLLGFCQVTVSALTLFLSVFVSPLALHCQVPFHVLHRAAE